ncbi:MAG: stage II sporulation protein M [Actinobacteria bacterium]|nr:stage II sporulation protein M [Actinomycetota bacterium]
MAGNIKPAPRTADETGMEARPANANDLIFKETMRETRETLARWRRHPVHTISRWTVLAFLIAVTMLSSVLAVSHFVTADFTTALPNIYHDPDFHDVVRVFFRNILVLALHGFVCIAGFMAMRALPEQVKYKSGIDRWVHQHAGRFAMVWVTAATIFSITTQTWILGSTVADLSLTLGISQGTLLLTVLPHALLELTAVFLPLAAFLIASRQGRWHELLAATFVTVSAAIPMLIVAAFLEAYLWPMILRDVVL